MFQDNSVVITSNQIKNKLLINISKDSNLLNIKFMNKQEFIKNLVFDYNEKTIYYLMNKYDLKYENALELINNMYYIKDVKNKKIKFLFELKQELIENNLLIINNYFKDNLKNKKIYIYNIIITKEEKELFSIFDPIYINNESHYKINKIYALENINQEISFVAENISKLIIDGIDINNIKLTNITKEYHNSLKRIFSYYNIKVNIPNKAKLINTKIVEMFLNLLESDISITLSKLEEHFDFDNENNLNILNKIIDILNKYTWTNDYISIKDMLIYDFNNTLCEEKNYNNAVEIIDLKNSLIENEYIFLMNFNKNSIPIIYNDNDYLSDEEKQLLNINTSIELNKIEKEFLFNKMNSIKNLTITYKEKDSKGECYKSNLLDKEEIEIVKERVDISLYSNRNNKYLLTNYLDYYMKDRVLNNNLSKLYKKYNINYLSYDNKYKKIQPYKLEKYLNKGLTLSYSSLDNYYRCSFRYYLESILKISDYEETYMTYIGSLFHYILSKCFDDSFSFDKEYSDYLSLHPINFNHKEEFFLMKLKADLLFIIETIKKQYKHNSLDKTLYEEKIEIDKSRNIKIKFVGIIDKLLYKEEQERTLAVIIDYKTGTPDINLNNMIYGIGMQLPIYLYLSKNSKLKNVKILGFYLQKLLHSEIRYDKNKTYIKQKEDNLKLTGYSIDNEELLSIFDNSYTDSEVIKSLKVGNGGFYAYSKTLNENMIEKINNLVNVKIDEAIDNILDCNFDINPKIIANKNLGCEFCNYKDVCFKKEKDNTYLNEYKDLEFLRGEEND